VNAAETMARLRRLGVPVVSTIEAAQSLGVTVDAAGKMLDRLARATVVARVKHGLWALRPELDPLLLPDHLTAPLPSYVSLQTALHYHGLIEQIPAMIYVVSLGRARTIRTRFGTFSVHRVAPDLFGGFEVLEGGVKMATPEKALVDVLYLSATRNRTFAALPEVELPRTFDRRKAGGWMRRISSPTLREVVLRRWRRVIGAASVSR
jgi:predicted transcriptional regulator of viral defense system